MAPGPLDQNRSGHPCGLERMLTYQGNLWLRFSAVLVQWPKCALPDTTGGIPDRLAKGLPTRTERVA